MESAEFLGAVDLASPVPHEALPWGEKLLGSVTTLSIIGQITWLLVLTTSASYV